MPKSKHFILKKAMSAYFPTDSVFKGRKERKKERKREGNGWRGRNFFIKKG